MFACYLLLISFYPRYFEDVAANWLVIRRGCSKNVSVSFIPPTWLLVRFLLITFIKNGELIGVGTFYIDIAW